MKQCDARARPRTHTYIIYGRTYGQTKQLFTLNYTHWHTVTLRFMQKCVCLLSWAIMLTNRPNFVYLTNNEFRIWFLLFCAFFLIDFLSLFHYRNSFNIGPRATRHHLGTVKINPLHRRSKNVFMFQQTLASCTVGK